MKKLLLFLALFVGIILQMSAQSGYTITFSSVANSAATITTTTRATTFIASESQQYVDASPVYESTNVYYGGASDNEKSSIRFGTSSKAGNLSLNLSESGQISVTSITISAKKYASTDSNTTMTVCGQSFTVDTDDYTNYTVNFTETELTTLSLSTTGTSKNRVFVNAITIGVPPQKNLGTLTATCNGEGISSTLTIDQGNDIVFHADNATSFSVTVNEDEPVELTASNGSASWTPSVCENVNVSVTAKREADGEETQTSEPLTFNLTANKPDYVIATWIVTGCPTNSGESVDLKLDSEKSASGKWSVYSATSFYGGIGGGAQLGSSGNPFKDGTITLSESDIPDNAIIQEITFTGYTNDAYTLTCSVNGVSAGTITVAKSTETDHKLSDLSLKGNQIVFTATSASKYLCVKGFSVKYTIPEEDEEEQPGEITVGYIPQFSRKTYTDPTVLSVMAGTELTFTSANAAKIEITSESTIENLPEPATGESIVWAPEEQGDMYTITVTASSESGNKTATKTYTILAKEITPSTPEILAEDGIAKVTCTNGALQIKIEDYEPQTESTAMFAAEVQDWTFSPNETKGYQLDYSSIDTGRIISLSAKAVTPKAESEVAQIYLNNTGIISGIENVDIDLTNAPVIYYNLQGQRVEADRPGLYIRQQGSRAEKVAIR